MADAGCGAWSKFEKLRVLDTEVGYTGGRVKNPAMEMSKQGKVDMPKQSRLCLTKQVDWSFVDYFFACMINTEQAEDIGTQYRSALFYLSEKTKQTAESSLQSQCIPKMAVQLSLSNQGWGYKRGRLSSRLLSDST